MVSALISRIVILVFGTLYPAYKSYKAVNRRNAKEYVKWMMYWIVFALFTFVETFADLFVAWLPFYYEIKILFVLWLLSPATKGASILYKKFVHPALSRREKDIDTHLDKVTEQGYAAVLNLGSKGFNYATNVVLSTAIKGQAKLAENLKRSYSMSDVSDERPATKKDEVEEITDDDETDNRLIEESYQREINGEKDIDTTQQPKRRVKAKKEDLGNISEGEEDIPKSVKKAYSHKEFRSTPDNNQATRPASFSSPRFNRHSFSRFDTDSPRSSPKLRRNLKLDSSDYKPSYSATSYNTRSAPTTPVTSTPSSPSAFTSYSRYTRSTSTGAPSSPSSSSYPASSSWRSRSSYSFWK